VATETWTGGGAISKPQFGARGLRQNWSPARVPGAGGYVLLGGTGAISLVKASDQRSTIESVASATSDTDLPASPRREADLIIVSCATPAWERSASSSVRASARMGERA
jgi:hypothetical protein